MIIIEEWRQSLGVGGNAGALLTNLSKAFDCIHYNLLISKLKVYGLNLFTHTLLDTNKGLKQTIHAVSRQRCCFVYPGLYFRTLLFIIYLCDLSYYVKDFEHASFDDEKCSSCQLARYNFYLISASKEIDTVKTFN